MKVWRLIVLEIMHRKLGFGLAVATVATSVAALVAIAALLLLLHLCNWSHAQLCRDPR